LVTARKARNLWGIMVARYRLGKGIHWRIRGSVVRYWHPDIEKREKRDLQTGYLGNHGQDV
ncbi:MAG: hypothetical protein V3S71_01970, partial [Acidobacteriota bacterium]